MALELQIRTNAKQLMRGLKEFQRRALPQAIVEATNKTAQRVIDAETAQLSEKFDKPNKFTQSAFTMSGFGGQRASVRNPTAIIVAKPVQEAYLAPSEFDEPQSLGKGRRIRTPGDVRRDEGGNIPKGTIARLLARSDVFVGEINGTRGIWQRPAPLRPKGTAHTKAKGGGLKRNTTGKLKLLVAFTRPIKIKTHLGFRQRAIDIVTRYAQADLAEAVQRALR